MFLSRGLIILRNCKKFSACQKSVYSLSDNVNLSSICISDPSIVQFPRCKSYKRNTKSLLPYRIANENCEEVLHSQDVKDNIETHMHDKFRVLLNPAKHIEILNTGKCEAPADSKSLQVSVVGIPNAGKSTLVNQLIGSNICPHSQKVHTTRENVHGILTKDSIQVIFEASKLCEVDIYARIYGNYFFSYRLLFIVGGLTRPKLVNRLVKVLMWIIRDII